MSGSSVAISQNAYARAYSGVDLLTIMQTDKDIKRHIYDQVRRLDKTKKKEID
jgi:alpha-amylase/alpha-mannosidase (GH57 family)